MTTDHVPDRWWGPVSGRPGRADRPAGGVTAALAHPRWFAVRQVLLLGVAIFAYFGVRGLTEGSVEAAQTNAGRVLDLERSLGIAAETAVQDMAATSDLLVDLGNWVYIWCHWPVILGTFVWFARAHRGEYLLLRNAMFVSGAIGLVIFATFPVAPPRLLAPELVDTGLVDTVFVDTVSERSQAYRVLQPPAFTNLYAAVPSFHFGWNLLVGIGWFRVWRGRWWRWAGVLMPVAMGWAVVATGNHWVVDVAAGGAIALVGLLVARWSRDLLAANACSILARRGIQQPVLDLERARSDALGATWKGRARPGVAVVERRR